MLNRYILTLCLILANSSAHAKILPEIFYQSQETQESFCLEKENQNEKFWRNLINEAITQHVAHRSAEVQNSYVSLSYLELFQYPSKSETANFMSYVYANASHHLGRIIRYKKWPAHHPLKDLDRALVKGKALRALTQRASSPLSRRLMFHSLNLYKELAWSLASASLCGQEYTLKIVANVNLLKAFEAKDTVDFVTSFVSYEQIFLQQTMYSDFLIGGSAKARMLDEMRFISFNGEEHLAFADWCNLEGCASSSFHVQHRINFDVFSILKELGTTQGQNDELARRIENAKITETANIFL